MLPTNNASLENCVPLLLCASSACILCAQGGRDSAKERWPWEEPSFESCVPLNRLDAINRAIDYLNEAACVVQGKGQR